MKQLKDWCESGADVNLQNHLGFSALMASSQKGELKIVKILIEHGAYLNIKDKNNFTALYYATLHNHLEVVKYLIQAGAILTDEIYMTAILKDFKKISSFFDTLDVVKQILKTRPKKYTKVIDG